MNNNTKKLVTSSLLIAIATILSNIKLFALPMGGSVTACSMFFVILVAFFYGKKYGVISAFVYGMIQCAIDPQILSPVQFMIDYIFAYTALSCGAFLFSNDSKFALEKYIIAGSVARFIFAVIAGVAFYSAYAPDGMGAITYSVLYNGSYILPELIITLVVVQIPAFKNAILRQATKTM